ncbi:NAD-dependent epimerase/dehydratase family protein [Rheinheimera texasensis]|uniref:NAD-dependent epimerase/dehydratase family protein n=1 Tax=Rheinheimera texasensis TaxID=306205 RepID=UPI0004E16BE6|nr:NAD(P)-dependent oxidoreductase [Rheinheimera texasensis]
MNIFITGTESFVGKRLIRALDQLGHKLSGIDAAPSSDGRFLQSDLLNPKLNQLIPQNTDIVIHLAALSRDPDCRNRATECFATNVMGTLALIDAVATHQVQQFIFASTEWVYDLCDAVSLKTENSLINISNHTSEYALSKLVSENNLRQKYQHGFCDTTILRFGIIYGPRPTNWSAVESLFFQVRDQTEIKVGSLETARSFIHVDDIVAGIIASFQTKGFEIINLQGSKLISLGEIISLSEQIHDKTVQISETAPAAPNIRNVSNEKATNLIGFRAQLDLEAGLRSLLTVN